MFSISTLVLDKVNDFTIPHFQHFAFSKHRTPPSDFVTQHIHGPFMQTVGLVQSGRAICL